MGNIIKSVGHGLLAAGILLTGVYFVAVYVKGTDALRGALDPLTLKNYLALAPLIPGALLLAKGWLKLIFAIAAGFACGLWLSVHYPIHPPSITSTTVTGAPSTSHKAAQQVRGFQHP
jgi:hypothetical protein